MTEFLGNENVQKALRLFDRRLRTTEIDDLNKLLATDFGRRVYCRLVFEMSAIESLSFDPGIKDGACQAQHAAFNDGMRAIGRLMFQEAQQFCPEAWALAQNERIAKAASDASLRVMTIEKSEKEAQS